MSFRNRMYAEHHHLKEVKQLHVVITEKLRERQRSGINTITSHIMFLSFFHEMKPFAINRCISYNKDSESEAFASLR